MYNLTIPLEINAWAYHHRPTTVAERSSLLTDSALLGRAYLVGPNAMGVSGDDVTRNYADIEPIRVSPFRRLFRMTNLRVSALTSYKPAISLTWGKVFHSTVLGRTMRTLAPPGARVCTLSDPAPIVRTRWRARLLPPYFWAASGEGDRILRQTLHRTLCRIS